MSKNISSVAVCLLSASISVCSVFGTPMPKTNILINNKAVVSDTAPIMRFNRVLVPLRVISENLGAEVDYDQQNKTVTVKRDNLEIVLTISRPLYTVNGIMKTTDVSPVIVDNRTMVPLRIISEELNCDVEWDNATKTVRITTSDGSSVELSPSGAEQVKLDPYGFKLRTTNLPTNAKCFKYISEGVPNEAYEAIDFLQWANQVAPENLGFTVYIDGKPYFDALDPSTYWACKPILGNDVFKYGVFFDYSDPRIASEKFIKYYDTILNFDYRTADKKKYLQAIKETIGMYKPIGIMESLSFYRNGDRILEEYEYVFDWNMKNKVITEGSVECYPQTFYIIGNKVYIENGETDGVFQTPAFGAIVGRYKFKIIQSQSKDIIKFESGTYMGCRNIMNFRYNDYVIGKEYDSGYFQAAYNLNEGTIYHCTTMSPKIAREMNFQFSHGTCYLKQNAEGKLVDVLVTCPFPNWKPKNMY